MVDVSLTIGMVGLIEHVDHITTQSFKHAGDAIYVIGKAEDDFGGSELQKMELGEIRGKAPAIDLYVEKERQNQVLQAIKEGVVSSATDVSEGGFLVALAKCLFGTNFGAKIEMSGEDLIKECFSETPSRFIISVPKDATNRFEEIVTDAICIGEVTQSPEILIEDKKGSIVLQEKVSLLEEIWKGAIPWLLK